MLCGGCRCGELGVWLLWLVLSQRPLLRFWRPEHHAVTLSKSLIALDVVDDGIKTLAPPPTLRGASKLQQQASRYILNRSITGVLRFPAIAQHPTPDNQRM